MAYPINQGHHNGRRTLIVPPTTDMALVFPFDHENKQFDKSFYSHYLTDGRASFEQIETFLKEAEDALKKKLKWLRRLKAYLIFSFMSGFFLMTLYSVLVFSDILDDGDDYSSEYNYHNTKINTAHANHSKNFRHQNKSQEFDIEEQIDVMFMAWIFLMFAALVWGIVFQLFKRCSIKKGRKSVQEVVDKYSSTFANAGLRWNLPLAFPHYIELWKDYRGQNYTQPNHQLSYNVNPLAFTQIQNQLQNQHQRYPTLPTNQVMNQHATLLDFQNNGVSSPLLNNPAQRKDGNSYVPPYPIHFVSNNQ